MAHYTLIRPGGWPLGLNPSVANWQALDDRIFSLVSGDKGGAWSPVDPIIFSNVSGMQVTGEAKIRDGVVVALSGANRITLVSRQVQKEQEGQVYFPDPSSTGTWTLSITGDQFWRQSVSGSELLTIPLRIPHGAVLNSVSVEVDPADHTAVPTYPPRIQVMRIDQNGSTIPLGAGVANDTFTLSVEVYE